MVYFAVTTVLVLHTFFWGAGLAALVVPKRLRDWWWIFAPGCGIALQSLVVWIGIKANLPGTNSYAWPSELLPLALLLIASLRRCLGRPPVRPLLGVVGIMLLVGLLLLGPMAKAGAGLHSSSLGSCDHADYAAGARTMAEFAPNAKTGFLGQSDVIRTGTTDNFFQFWTRLNHFSPSAILAHHSSILGIEIFRLVSVLAVSLYLLNLPMVWFLARLVAGLKGWRAWVVVLLYGISPLGQYGVHNGAIGQMLAANGLALILVMTVWTDRAAGSARAAWQSLPLFITAFWILLGGYHFIVIVSLAQAGACLGVMAYVRREFRHVLRTLAVLLTGLAITVFAFVERTESIAERFVLFDRFDFGWKIPSLTFEGWVGLVRDADLHGWTPGWRLVLAAGLIILWTLGVVHLWRRNPRRALLLPALVMPVALGWLLLSRESLARDNATYDAYKLLAVFRPGLLVGLLGGLALVNWTRRQAWIAAIVIAIIGANAVAGTDFILRMSHPALRTDHYLADIGLLEQRPEIKSVNIHLTVWERLWANYFLLRKQQYFPVATYEGRNATGLAGGWDLYSRGIRLLPPEDKNVIILNDVYFAVRKAFRPRVAVTWGSGWHGQERFGSMAWRWAGNKGGSLWLENPSDKPVKVRLRLRAAGFGPNRMLQIRQGATIIGVEALKTKLTWTDGNLFTLPPGRTRLVIATVRPTETEAGEDGRVVSVRVSKIEVRRVDANESIHEEPNSSGPTRKS